MNELNFDDFNEVEEEDDRTFDYNDGVDDFDALNVIGVS